MSRLQQGQRLTLHGSAISIEEELGPGIFLARDSKGLPTLVDGKFYRGNVWAYDTSGPYYGARVAVDRDRTPYKKLTFRTVRGGEAALIPRRGARSKPRPPRQHARPVGTTAATMAGFGTTHAYSTAGKRRRAPRMRPATRRPPMSAAARGSTYDARPTGRRATVGRRADAPYLLSYRTTSTRRAARLWRRMARPMPREHRPNCRRHERIRMDRAGNNRP